MMFWLSFVFFALAAQPQTEIQKIEALLSLVEKSQLIFVRNGEEYPPTEAAKHLRQKLTAAQKSMFAPKGSEWTAKMFIEKVASKSSLSGKPYLIKRADGETMEAKRWLSEKLAQMEAP